MESNYPATEVVRDGVLPIPRRMLSPWDCVSIIIGIVVGVGIFETPPAVARGGGSPVGSLILWFLGGLASLAGALCFAELGTRYPAGSGIYSYLREAFGSRLAFVYAWSASLVVLPGSIALTAFPFARYTLAACGVPFEGHRVTMVAVVAVVVCTLMNLLRQRGGQYFQNTLSIIKIVGSLIICAAIAKAPSFDGLRAATPVSLTPTALHLGCIMVLFTFGGWSELGFVTAEVKDPRRNIARSLVMGVGVVTILYIALNATFFIVLGYEGVVKSQAVAQDVVTRAFGATAARFVSVLVAISALGAVQGLIFTGARVYFKAGEDYAIARYLGAWNEAIQSPARALITQACITVLIIVTCQTFDDTIARVTPVIWFFYLLSGLALFVVRSRDSGQVTRFLTPGYPLIPIVFCASCLYLVYSAVSYDLWGAGVTGALCLLGIPAYAINRRIETCSPRAK